jgi:hypothetical protein
MQRGFVQRCRPWVAHRPFPSGARRASCAPSCVMRVLFLVEPLVGGQGEEFGEFARMCQIAEQRRGFRDPLLPR